MSSNSNVGHARDERAHFENWYARYRMFGAAPHSQGVEWLQSIREGATYSSYEADVCACWDAWKQRSMQAEGQLNEAGAKPSDEAKAYAKKIRKAFTEQPLGGNADLIHPTAKGAKRAGHCFMGDSRTFLAFPEAKS